MRSVNVRLFTIFLCLHFLPASGRENKDLLKANYYYAHFAYYDAIPYFEKVADTINSAVIYARLGDCYWVTNNLEKASNAYSKAVNIKDCSNDVILRYSQLLMQLTQYDDAEKWLKEYRKSNENEKRAANLILGCEAAKKMNVGIPPGVLTLLPFNTNGSDFAPTLWNSRLVFASDTVTDVKKKTDNWTGKAYYNIYSVSCDENGRCGNDYTRVANTKEVNIKYHNGPCTFSADGRQMYFTRSRYNDNFFSRKAISNKDSMILLEIMIASDYDSASGKFRKITPFQYNSEEYAVAHPSVSPDGKTLAFSSNMPKGHGQSDIYLCRKINGSWSRPVNAGDSVNTEGEEFFPYWADDSTLFFSSDGHPGMGGLDIYKCKWNQIANEFSTPENIGPPVNSSYDDISLAIKPDGMRTWFSSNRPASKGGDNIYFFRKEKVFLQLNVFDSITRQVIPSANILIEGDNDKSDATTNSNGRFFRRLYPEQQYKIRINKFPYTAKQLLVTATGNSESDTIFRNVYLSKVGPSHAPLDPAGPKQLVIKYKSVMDTPGIRVFELNEVYEVGHFYYDYNKFELTDIHKIFLDTLLAQLNRHPTMRIQIRAHTDCRGSAALNKTLSDNRALSVVNYLVKHGIMRQRLEYRGLGSGEPVVNCPICEECTEEQHYLNRVLDFKVLEL